MLTGYSWGLDELDPEQLPNGLHDATIENIEYDLLSATVTMRLAVWVGSLSQEREGREKYRRGLLIFRSVRFLAKSAPYDGKDQRADVLSCARNRNLEPSQRAAAPASDDCYRFNTGYCEIDIDSPSCEFKWVPEPPFSF